MRYFSGVDWFVRCCCRWWWTDLGCTGMWYMRLKVEGGSRKRHVREPSQASTGSCDLRLQAIPLIHKNISPLTRNSHSQTHKMQSTRAFNMLRQRAAPVFRAQQPVRGLRLQSTPKMRSPANVRTARNMTAMRFQC